MMGRRSGRMAMVFMDIKSLIPENHLLRKINRIISSDFIHDLLAPYYPTTGRPSIDPVSMFKMLLVGYLYRIKSERRLEEEMRLNIAYRWFCGFELDDTIPDHSTFSKTRMRKWQHSDLFQKAFQEIVKQCIRLCRQQNFQHISHVFRRELCGVLRDLRIGFNPGQNLFVFDCLLEKIGVNAVLR